jgi:hypothetical protein
VNQLDVVVELTRGIEARITLLALEFVLLFDFGSSFDGRVFAGSLVCLDLNLERMLVRTTKVDVVASILEETQVVTAVPQVRSNGIVDCPRIKPGRTHRSPCLQSSQ